MKIVFVMDDKVHTLDRINPATLSLYDILNYLNSHLKLNKLLLDKIGNQKLLLEFSYVDKNGVAGTLTIDTNLIDNFHRYNLSLQNIFAYLMVSEIPEAIYVDVLIQANEMVYHSHSLLSQISRGRSLSQPRQIEAFITNLNYIYDMEYIYEMYFLSDCLPHFKILLTASMDDSRTPEIKHAISDMRLSYWDNKLIGTPLPIAEKCTENYVDLIDFYEACEMNQIGNADSITHLNIKKYVNNNLRVLAKILFYPQIATHLKQSICSKFRECIFHIIKNSIERTDADFYYYLTDDGETLASTSARNCVAVWFTQSSKDSFTRLMTPILETYTDRKIHATIISILDKEHRKWFFELSPLDDNLIAPWFSFKEEFIGERARFFPIPNQVYLRQRFRSQEIENSSELLLLQDQLINNVLSGDRSAVKSIINHARTTFPSNYWQLILDYAPCYEAHANRQWFISPLEFATWSGDIHTAILLIEALPKEIHVLEHALLQIKNVVSGKNQVEHGVFMAPFHTLLFKCTSLALRYNPKSKHSSQVTNNHRTLQTLGADQQQLPLYGLQVLCDPTDFRHATTLDNAPRQECLVNKDHVLDIADLGSPWVLAKLSDGCTLINPKLPSTHINANNAYPWLSNMQTILNYLCQTRAKDFAIEITCLENQIKQLQNEVAECKLANSP